ncbi:MAG: hypothetical protein PHW74_12910 [Desulfobacca sp.]|nr:hypothetical protein [Desulfobacca sp.]
MKEYRSKYIHALEFGCQAPLRFYEHCSSCPHFGADCPDLQLGIEILQGRKKLIYCQNGAAEGVHVSQFTCQAPLHYFEKTRENCPHHGHCREEGLLLALLNGKKQLDCRQASVVNLPVRPATRPYRVEAEVELQEAAL